LADLPTDFLNDRFTNLPTKLPELLLLDLPVHSITNLRIGLLVELHSELLVDLLTDFATARLL
jgi:hypothetical protein